MKKRLIAFGMLIVLVVCMSMTVFAANGVSTEEEALLNRFSAILAKYEVKGAVASQYIAEATNALTKVDLDSNACKEFDGVLTQVDALLASKNAKGNDLRQSAPQVAALINTVAPKYGMTVSVDTNTTIATVSFGGDVVAKAGTGIINQTGVNTTATVAVIGGIALISLLGVGAFVASRSKKVAR